MNAPTKPEPVFQPPEYEFHELAKIFPLINDEELRELAEDIKKQGLIYPITIYEGKILDGRNRWLAAKQCGYQFLEHNFKPLPDYREPKEFVISTNIRRRNLSTKRKRELLAELIKDDPTKSDRQIAAIANVDNKTATAVRKEMEEREEIPHVETKTDTTGRKQPATKGKKKTAAVPAEPVKPATSFIAHLELMIEALSKFKSYEHAEEYVGKAKARLDQALLQKMDEEGEQLDAAE